MALTESITERLEVLEDGQLQIKTVTRILRDGAEIAKTIHREAVAPGADVSQKSARAKAIAAAVWTPDVVSAYVDLMKRNTPGTPQFVGGKP